MREGESYLFYIIGAVHIHDTPVDAASAEIPQYTPNNNPL